MTSRGQCPRGGFNGGGGVLVNVFTPPSIKLLGGSAPLAPHFRRLYDDTGNESPSKGDEWPFREVPGGAKDLLEGGGIATSVSEGMGFERRGIHFNA